MEQNDAKVWPNSPSKEKIESFAFFASKCSKIEKMRSILTPRIAKC